MTWGPLDSVVIRPAGPCFLPPKKVFVEDTNLTVGSWLRYFTTKSFVSIPNKDHGQLSVQCPPIILK